MEYSISVAEEKLQKKEENMNVRKFYQIKYKFNIHDWKTPNYNAYFITIGGSYSLVVEVYVSNKTLLSLTKVDLCAPRISANIKSKTVSVR